MRILLVDDKQAVQDSLVSLLSQLGYEVETATNGLNAFEKAQNANFDLYIIDHLMPLMNGVQLTKNLKQTPQCKAIPILFMTTQGLDAVSKLEEFSQFSDVICKPVDSDNLIEKLVKLGIFRPQAQFSMHSNA
ncbi:response regulator [Colwellia sp. RSH04]|uniref:response regulator n=1 Tax=Colwellia sp. RSH04 TaxID=2305464 RepID=UPI000E588B1C|nr:response regulator [Colwellia sp. RSH04]RHW75633.1 response regulator [Colwellia sp. RSH04]